MNKLWLLLLLAITNLVYAHNGDLLIINAIINPTEIRLVPDTIPNDNPFMIHVINKTGVAVELENSDTSVEVYDGMDKTFKIGLAKGDYKFFNDFNPKTKTAILHVVPNTSIASTSISDINNQPVNSSPEVITSKSKLSEIFFIIWRESIEALLVVGIVFSWIKHLKVGQKSAMVFLWLGVAIGLACAIILGFGLIELSSIVTGETQNYLQAIMIFIAAAMIVYMVKWMRANARTLKTDMLNTISKNSNSKWNISILIVVAIAIAREGSEAMIFIYAIGFGQHGNVSFSMSITLLLGIIAAIFTVYLFQLSNRIFNWKYFFKITEILLLLLSGGLLLNCTDLLISAGLFSPLHTKIWDTSFLISDGGYISPILSSFIGYRSTPSLTDLIVYLLYWITVYFILKNRPGLRSIQQKHHEK